MHLTELAVRALRTERAQQTFFDDHLKGFGVRVTKSGTKTYVLMHGNDRRLATIGRVDALGLKEARDKARLLLTKKDEATIAFGEARETFLAMHVRLNNRLSTAESTELRLKHFAGLDDRSLASLKTGDFTAITDGLITAGKPSEALHAFVAAKTMLNFCIRRGYIERHPLQALTRPVEPRKRDRWLTAQEIAKLASWRPGAHYSLVLRVLLWTGQRLGQIKAFDPAWIEDDTVRFPAAVMKGKREHVIPITETTSALLKSLTPYNNWSDMHRLMLKETALPHFTRHDLRRTYATHMAQLGIAPHIIERLLDHQTGTLSTIARTYNRYSFMAEMREAVDRWEAHLQTLLAPMSG